MTYEAFKKELSRNLQLRELSQGRQVILLEKGNIFTRGDVISMIRLMNLANYGKEDTVLRDDTICVVWKKQGIRGILHWNVRELYEKYKREGWQGVLPEMVVKIQRTERQGGAVRPNETIANEVLANEAFAEEALANEALSERNRLIIRPMHYPAYREELEDAIFWIFGDVALVLYLLVYDGWDDFLTVKMNRDMIEGQNITDEALLTNALLNTAEKMPPKISIYSDKKQKGVHRYRVSTEREWNGAVAFFYPGVKERLAEILGGDYYVGFRSIHEVVAYPVRYKVLNELKVSIQRANLLRERREMLTNRVYRYSCSRKELIEV